jgi:hypothetical protein
MTRRERAALQRAINSGSIWKMEGSAGRAAMDAIRNGDCILGPRAVFDYYGNRVPSRFEVESGSLGSIAYAKKAREWRAENEE